MAAGSTYEKVATQTLGSAASSVTFSSISGSYTDLVLVANFINATTTGNSLLVRVGNGSIDTGSNYSTTFLEGNGSTASSSRTTTQTFGYLIGAGISTSTTNPQPNIVHFMNYSNTTTFKTFLNRGGTADTLTTANVNLYRSTSAINTIQIVISGSINFATGSTFTLYGIAAA